MPIQQSKYVRPDFSQFVVHFTKNDAPLSIPDDADEVVNHIAGLSAFERLIAMLTTKHIQASKLPWTNKPAICFTECTWSSLLDHAKRYSRFGIGFTKAYLFSRGGGPAIYLAPGLFEHQKNYIGKKKMPFSPLLFSFVTPFMPSYAPAEYKERFWQDHEDEPDYSYEREWRVPHHLDFEYQDIEFVIVDSYLDMAKAPKELKDSIGREKWLIMDNYETIENLWPVHRMPDNDKK